jgi:biotin synthase
LHTEEPIKKSRLGEVLSKKELVYLLGLAPYSAEMIELTASFNPSYSGAARRIPIPGTAIAKRGVINEMRMAQIVAVTRLGMPRSVIGNCTHEPCALGAISGANLFWAEVGANPRDVKEKTEEGRAETVNSCRSIFQESNWDVWSGPSRYYYDKK